MTVERDVRKLRREKTTWAIASADILAAAAADLRRNDVETKALLRSSIEGFDAANMKLHAAVARHRLATLIGGDEGRALQAGCDEYMAREGVKVPAKAIEMIAPGFR